MKVVNINKALLVGIISLIVVNFSTLIYQKYTDKETDIPKAKLKDQEEKKDIFAIMLEQSDGTYQATDSTSFNQLGYKFNNDKSGCIDVNGNKIENALSYDETTKAIGVTSNKTTYCYVYFDLKSNLFKICGNLTMNECINNGKINVVDSLWQSGLESDGYRYIGTNPDNYICFGTKDRSTCTGNTDTYMYRIIGVFPDSEGNQHMKLIKKEALNTTMKWNSSDTNVNWESSTLFNAINGSTYLTNTTYMPTGWSDRITKWKWSAVNTKTMESSGPNYSSGVTTKQMYLHELNRSGKPSGGAWTSPEKQIGLMYMSDYALSLGSSALNCISNSNYSTLKTGWMHLSNNDIGAPDTDEWTLSRYGNWNWYYGAWRVYSDGNGDYDYVTSANSVRPVFYMNSDQVISSGSGEIDNPFILL